MIKWYRCKGFEMRNREVVKRLEDAKDNEHLSVESKEAIRDAISLVKYFIPYPVIVKDWESTKYFCPMCDSEVGFGTQHCPECKQELNWESPIDEDQNYR